VWEDRVMIVLFLLLKSGSVDRRRCREDHGLRQLSGYVVVLELCSSTFPFVSA
jgi:hypothetical protein